MSIIVTLILGAIVGWLGARLMGRDEGLFASIIIGIVGAFIGSAVASLFGSSTGYLELSWASFVWSLIGAVILSALLNMVQHRSSHHHV